MKFSIALVSLASSAALVSAAPLIPKGHAIISNKNVVGLKSQPVGAVYFQTNEPAGNFVVVGDVAVDGTLSWNRAVATHGNGSHGVTDPVGPDALFSQGSVKASATGKVLAAVNAGSNTVSLFAINPQNPAVISLVGKPASSGGEFPMSVALNANGTMACALNGGAVNGVSCFTVNAKSGLVPVANSFRSLGLSQTTPPSGPAGSASHVIFNEKGTQLIASVKGIPPTPGFFAVWDVAADGTLSQNFTSVAPPTGGALPFSMTVIPGQNAILSTDPGVGFDVVDLSGNTAELAGAGNRSTSSAVPITGQSATCWSSFSKQTGNIYLTDIGTSTVTEVNVANNLNATIVMQYPLATMSATIDNDIASLNGNDFMFVLAPNATSVNVLSLNAPGKATNLGMFDFATVAKAAGLTISANNLQGITSFIKAK